MNRKPIKKAEAIALIKKEIKILANPDVNYVLTNKNGKLKKPNVVARIYLKWALSVMRDIK